jgi:hypothetical protein
MSEKVVGLFGAFQPQPAETSANVIRELERLLEAARSGEIVGFAGSYLHKDRVVSYSYAGAIGGYAMIGGLDCVKERLVRIALARD